MAEFPERAITTHDLQERCTAWVESQRDVVYSESTWCTKPSSDDESYCTNSEFDSVSECGARKPRPGKPLKDEVYRLPCEWQGCGYVSSQLERFVRHVAGHMPDVGIRMTEEGTEVYVCRWSDCAYETNMADQIKRHVNYHSYHTKLKCIGSNVRGRVKLPRCRRDPEWRNIFDLPPPLFCRWEECLMPFSNYQLYLFHVAAHTNDNPRGNRVEGGVECKWTGCSSSFPNLHKLRDHMKKHTKEKLVACPDCGATFASNTKFHVHCKRQIPIEVQGFQCSHCSKFYPTEGILRDHMRMHVFNYKCTLCEMSCESPASLAKHVRYRHVATRTFPCQLCSHAAKSQQDLDTHMSVHTTGPNFSCHFEGCKYRCKGAYTLDRHIERAHTSLSRLYCCHECPLRYRTSSRLTRHLIATHQLQLPNGHTRFQYTHDEDGCYRLQMVRYEAIEEEEGPILAGAGEKKYRIRVQRGVTTRVDIVEDDAESGASDAEEAVEVRNAAPILISIDETDADGNIINSEVVEAQETMELPQSDEPPLIFTNTE